MLEISPIMLALCFMLSSPHYAKNYAGIIDSSLVTVAIGIIIIHFYQLDIRVCNELHKEQPVQSCMYLCACAMPPVNAQRE